MIQIINSQTDAIVHTVIDDYHAADDLRTVDIVVIGFAWDVEKTVQLIQAAPTLYDTMNTVLDYIVQYIAPADLGPDADNIITLMKRATAAAKGAVLMSDRMVTR